MKQLDTSRIEVIGFDADDTLWENEAYFRETEDAFCRLMTDYCNEEDCHSGLYEIEMQNMALYGFGVKAFTLSLVEAALSLSNGKAPASLIEEVITLGKNLGGRAPVPKEGVQDCLEALQGRYQLVLVTKGELLYQERKLKASGLAPYFHHIEILSGKTIAHYEKLFKRLALDPRRFLMVGNSLPSDIRPPIQLGAQAIWIPHHVTWAYEERVELEDEVIKAEAIGALAKLLLAGDQA